MKFLPYLLKHLRRNWVRTTSTVLAMGLCIFLFCTLQSVLAEINALLESTSANRLVTRHSVSLVFNLPLSYKARIEGLEGVKRVAVNCWFGGSLPAEKESWIERRIREAAERGEFDDLPGSGEPLAVLDEPYEPNWWVKRWIEREGLGADLADALRTHRTQAALDAVRRRRR